MQCPECGYDTGSQTDTCHNAQDILPPEAIPEDIAGKPAPRFSTNQRFILYGCILLLLSLNLNFFTVRVLDWSYQYMFGSRMSMPNYTEVRQSGFASMYSDFGFGAFIHYSNIFELLVPLVVVAALTLLCKINRDGKLMAVYFSIVGLCIAASNLAVHTLFGRGNNSVFMGRITVWDRIRDLLNINIGLSIFFALWVGITIFAFCEYKGIEIIQRPKSGHVEPPTPDIS